MSIYVYEKKTEPDFWNYKSGSVLFLIIFFSFLLQGVLHQLYLHIFSVR